LQKKKQEKEETANTGKMPVRLMGGTPMLRTLKTLIKNKPTLKNYRACSIVKAGDRTHVVIAAWTDNCAGFGRAPYGAVNGSQYIEGLG
jgi:hypothetical protein